MGSNFAGISRITEEKKIEFIENHEKRFNEVATPINDECSICIDNFHTDDKIVHLECKHLFHSDCFEEYLDKYINNKTSCPLCRQGTGLGL
jgi:hypothetical protein